MDIFSALAEPTRRAIVEMLASRGPLPATEIYQEFRASPPAISQHLKVLREANLVLMEKHAQQRVYRVNPEAISELEGWARNMMELWNQRFDALDQVLEVEKRKKAMDQTERLGAMYNQKTRELTFTRIFNAPRELVFRAFSDAELIRQWWAPNGWTVPVCTLDFRPDGEWRYSIRNAAGEEHWARAVYQKIVPGELIVFIDEMIDAQGNLLEDMPVKQVTLIFEDRGAQTQLTVRVQPRSQADLDKLIELGFVQGFTESLDHLEKYLQAHSQHSS